MASEREDITWTREKLRVFKASRDLAIINKKDRFEFDGYPFLVSYSKYLIEYLEDKFKQ
jgi:hypothetical protein